MKLGSFEVDDKDLFGCETDIDEQDVSIRKHGNNSEIEWRNISMICLSSNAKCTKEQFQVLITDSQSQIMKAEGFSKLKLVNF